jgi:ribosome-associated protein
MQEEDEDDYGKPSKSQRKRDADVLQDLGTKLTELAPGALKKCALPEELLDAIREYQRLPNKQGALHRQRQFIGKQMRDLTEEQVARIAAQVMEDVTTVKRRYMALEELRTKLLKEHKDAFEQLSKDKPDADMELVRSLVKQAREEQRVEATPLASRKLFQLLRQLYGV